MITHPHPRGLPMASRERIVGDGNRALYSLSQDHRHRRGHFKGRLANSDDVERQSEKAEFFELDATELDKIHLLAPPSGDGSTVCDEGLSVLVVPCAHLPILARY